MRESSTLQGVSCSPDADIDVLRRVAAGDAEAMRVLYDRHAGLLLALGMRIVGVQREAEDLLHDVFLEVWRHAGEYDPRRGSVKTWLILRMRSRGLDRLRSHAFSRTDALPSEPTCSSAPDKVERDLDGVRVRALLESLPPEQREVLELGYYKGMSFAEIAEALHIPLGTVKSRASAAIIKLRESLGVEREAS